LLAPAPRTSSVPDDVVTVRRGDSLWSLAARHLGPGASDREIALTWPQWYAANAELIGPDPNLIRPGQQLRIPTVGGH
jgi:nucleoid-associated protein YgaU